MSARKHNLPPGPWFLFLHLDICWVIHAPWCLVTGLEGCLQAPISDGRFALSYFLGEPFHWCEIMLKESFLAWVLDFELRTGLPISMKIQIISLYLPGFLLSYLLQMSILLIFIVFSGMMHIMDPSFLISQMTVLFPNNSYWFENSSLC